jgi:hypothetical protein
MVRWTAGSAVTTAYGQRSVRALVLAMYSSGANDGFLIRDATEGQDAEQQFFAREKGETRRSWSSPSSPRPEGRRAASGPRPP